MKKLLFILLATVFFILSGCSQKEKKDNEMLLIEGGAFLNTVSNFYNEDIIVPDFYMSKYEVTQEEWFEIMGYNPSYFQGDKMPVEMVSWYDCIEYCNHRSIKEGLNPYYNIDMQNEDPNNDNQYDVYKYTVTINEGADGYRLPTELEWEYAASGGQKSGSYQFSGSNDIYKVAWFWENSGDEVLTGEWIWAKLEANNCQTNEVGSKAANELGFYDMSGNVREWCWDSASDFNGNNGFVRVWRGGGWIGDANSCETSFRNGFEASGLGPDQGFRVCRDK